jgi:predicted TIM-barrel fold metal-dependent hydrolase
MEIIDVHVHALPRGTMCGGEADARLETLLAALEANGIGRAVLLPINDLSWQPVQEMNDFSVQVVKEHPHLAGFIDLDLSRVHYSSGIEVLEAEIVRRQEQGLRGIKVHPQNLGLDADDWRLLPVYRLAGEIGLPVTIHCYPGSPPGTMENSHPRHIEKVVRVFRNTTFIIAHLGGVPYFPLLPLLCQHNVYFDTSGVLSEMWGFYRPGQIRHLLAKVGYERILFGSDFPEEIGRQVAILREVVPEDRQAEVLAGNAERLGERFGWWGQVPSRSEG